MFHPHSHLPISFLFAHRGALSEACSISSIDPTRVTAPGSARVAQCAGDAVCFSATWLRPRGAHQAGICLPYAQCQQARNKFGGCLTAPCPLWIFFFSLHLHLFWVYSTNCLLWMLEIVLWSYFRDALDDLWDKEVGVWDRQRSFWGSFLGSSPVMQA